MAESVKWIVESRFLLSHGVVRLAQYKPCRIVNSPSGGRSFRKMIIKILYSLFNDG